MTAPHENPLMENHNRRYGPVLREKRYCGAFWAVA